MPKSVQSKTRECFTYSLDYCYYAKESDSYDEASAYSTFIQEKGYDAFVMDGECVVVNFTFNSLKGLPKEFEKLDKLTEKFSKTYKSKTMNNKGE